MDAPTQPPVTVPTKNENTASTPPPRRFRVPVYATILLLIVSFLGGLLIAALYFQSQLRKTNGNSPNEVVKTPIIQKLVIGTDPTLPPMEFMQGDQMVGYDIDLGNFLAEEMGAQVEFKNIAFDDLFTALEQEEIDMIISAVTITEERQALYDFSEPYLNAGQVIITRSDTAGIGSTADLQGKMIAVQVGTTNEEEALKHTSEDLVIRYDDFVQATQALVDGKVDAIFTDLPNAKGITEANPDLVISSDPFTNEYYGIVLRKGDPSVSQIDEALSAIRVKGVLTDLKQKWLD